MPSSTRERFVEPRTTEALARLRRDVASPFREWSQPFTLTLGTDRVDVLHGMGVIPDGVLVVRTDGVVTASPGVEWTTTAAYLVAAAANTHATVLFYTLAEVPNEA